MRPSVHDEYRARADDHWWFRARRRIFDRLLQPLAPRGGAADILDLGPGSGVNLPVLASRGRVIAVDCDAPSLRGCRAAGADTVVADAAMLPLPTASMDLVCALDVIEHLDDDRRALAELARVLRPDGVLLLSVPALRVLWGRQDVLSEHRRRYRRAELRDLLVTCGFDIERLSFFNTLLFPPILAARIAMRPLLRRSVATGHSDLAMRSPWGLDRVLESVFALEGPWLARRNLPIGVSLLAIARPVRRPS